MSLKLLKSGSCSVLLGARYYAEYYPLKKDYLLKVSTVNANHDESKHLGEIRTISNYESYFAINDEASFLLKPTDKFYSFLKELFIDFDVTFFNNKSDLQCYYIPYAGELDLVDAIQKIQTHRDKSLFHSSNCILEFIRQIVTGLFKLHDKGICHLDVKLENIVVDVERRQFRLIDFGFASKFPFDDYIKDIRGTPAYFPKDFSTEVPTPWLPQIVANDTTGDPMPMQVHPGMVYRIDSYCFGRVVNVVNYMVRHHIAVVQHRLEKKNAKKIDKIIKCLTHKNVYKRSTIEDIWHKYFNPDKI